VGAASEAALVQRLRQARAAGINLFDLGGGTDPPRAFALVAAAFPDESEDTVLLLPGPGLRQAGSGRMPAAPGTAPPPPPSPRVGFTRLTEIASTGARGLDAPERSQRDLPTAKSMGTVVRMDPEEGAAPALVPGALYVGPYSLLEQRLRSVFGGASPGSPASLLARDPFAGGRLDGTRISRGWLGRGPPDAPASLRSLSSEFEPVLRLAFLTEGRTRTLAQAALQYVTSRPWVASALVPLPSPERLAEMLDAFSRPPLTADEVARIERVGSAVRR
jgi:hypothetical protein